MKRWLIGLTVLTLAVGSLGCTGQPAANADGSGDATGSTVVTGKVAANAETPIVVVERFLQSLQAGDSATAESLLTEKSRKETAAHEWKVQPPGSPAAKFTIVENVEQEGMAYVSSDWTEPVSDSESATYNIVWILKPDAGAWRISGMITEFGADSDLMLSFEDIEGMIKTIQDAETQLAQAATAAASPPGAGATAANAASSTSTVPASSPATNSDAGGSLGVGLNSDAGISGSLQFDGDTSGTPSQAGAGFEGSLR